VVATPFVEEHLSKRGHYHYTYHDHYHETRVFPLSVLSGSDIVIEMRRKKTKVKERALIHPLGLKRILKKRKVYSEVLCTCMRVCVYLCELRF